jgi:hypothetical protein
MMRLRAISVLLLAAAIIWAAPLIGLALAGRSVATYLSFPPRTRFLPHAPFEWSAFLVIVLPIAGALALYWRALAGAPSTHTARMRSRFPWWGVLGIGLTAFSWYFAWHEASIPPAWRRHVFTPLWLGYILTMNGLAFRQTGWAPLTHRTKWFLALFVVSGAFWWLFEHLNRFVGDWYYIGIEASGDWDYFLQGTLPFSTVLPAVASTWAWLGGFPRLDAMRLPVVRSHRSLSWFALSAGLIALVGIGIWPDALFPALWLAPLLILIALQRWLLGETLFSSLRLGDCRPVLQPALAALICGFFWELWNFGSLAQWRYSIPYVQRFHLFEMPLLGYAGYLPFGVECALVMDLVARWIERRGVWPLADKAALVHIA